MEARRRDADNWEVSSIPAWLGFAFAILAAERPTGLALPVVPSPDDTCGVRIRAARDDELRLVDRNPLLGEPPNANDAPGPGSLRARVRNDSLHHPHIDVDDVSRGTSRRLCSGCMPRWSPDGKWIAFNGWQSRERPYVLRIVDPVTGSVRQIDAIDHIEDYAWSPDATKLGFAAMRTQHFRWEIGWVDIPEGTVHLAGIDQGPAEYGHFAWAPDGLRFVVNRYEYEHDDSLHSSDLWLYDLGGRRCRLTTTPRTDEEDAGWIDDRSIRFTLLDWNTPADTVASIHRVVELAPR